MSTGPGPSAERRREIIDALRRGTVPQRGLGDLAVGLDRFAEAVDDELSATASGGAAFKAVRGEYGSGKTFFARWLSERASRRGFAVSEVQVSESETPLHRLETVYRRMTERLQAPDAGAAGLRAVLEEWVFALQEDALAEGRFAEDDTDALLARTQELMEERLATITQSAPAFSAALRGWHRASVAGEKEAAEGLLAWIGGQPNVSARITRTAGVKGALDHFGALSFLQGLLVVLRDAGRPGLLLVLDEVETLQRVRGDVRDKGLNALRQLIDEIDAGRFPGLYLVITGTPAFFDGPQGVTRLPPLAQRLHVDFLTEARFDNPRAVQVRLPGFSHESLTEVGRRVRDIYRDGAGAGERVAHLVDDAYVADLATAVTGQLGGRVGIVPRLFLKKLVGDVLDRVDQFADFDPRRDYSLAVGDGELTLTEREARRAVHPDEIDIEA